MKKLLSSLALATSFIAAAPAANAANYNPEISDDDGSCITCASAGKCLPNDTDEGDNCNDVGNGCCDGYCETAGDCSPSFRQSFTAENGTYYPSCFG